MLGSGTKQVARMSKHPKFGMPKVPSIINECNCNKDDANGLTKESTIVDALCKDVNNQSPKPSTANNTTSTGGGNNKPGYGSGDDSTPGNASGDGSGNDNATDTSTNDSSPAPATNAAVSVQWAGSFMVTLGAVVVGLTL
ncbi:7090_t:CDS:2 [Paraglomus occultum]|uniref:7090_t:CDS:1 n=1 Tax=Paraglomus occultum TaxID=144539 RepID=A0A9N9C425_9GLOM|nr:7090_t:CDS:2 [Paraglomus occultum]